MGVLVEYFEGGPFPSGRYVGNGKDRPFLTGWSVVLWSAIAAKPTWEPTREKAPVFCFGNIKIAEICR